MNDEQLRDRIGHLDPSTRDVAIPRSSAEAHELLEQIMQTDIDTAPATPDTAKRRRAPLWLAGAAAAVIAAGAALVVTGVFDGDSGDEPDLADAVVLSLGEGQDPAASCLRPDATVLAPVPLAFAGTATEVDGERVVLDVTEWYVGTEDEVAADTVELTAPAGLEALTGGITFEVGEPYLISAQNGVVNYCGLSGPATPQLQAIFEAAFG